MEASKFEVSFSKDVDRINVVAVYLIEKAWREMLGGGGGFPGNILDGGENVKYSKSHGVYRQYERSHVNCGRAISLRS